MTVLVTSCVLFMAQDAVAGGFEIPDQSAVAGAMGGTGTARRGDPSSAWYNPSEVADGRGFRGGIGVFLALPSITAAGQEGPMETATTESTISTPAHLHLSFSRRWWALGAYVGTSHGSSVLWPEGWWGRFESIQTQITGIRAAPFLALRFGGSGGLIRQFPDIRLSAGVHVDTFIFDSIRALDFIDQEGRVHLSLWGTGVGADASLYWQILDHLNFGFSYQSRTALELRGDADFEVPDTFVSMAPDQHATAEFVVPDRIAVGLAWQQPAFAVFFDVTISLWSVRERLQVDFEQEETTDIDRPTNWQDSVSVRIGGEYSPLSWLHLRLGGLYDMQVGPDDTLTSSSPEMAKLGITTGLGVEMGSLFGADIQYSYLGFLSRESTGQDAALTGYSGGIHLVGLTLRVAITGARQAEETDE